MPPFQLLCIVVAVTAGTAGIYGIMERRRRSALRALAREWEMHFSARDPFKLAARIAPKLSIPGAADVRLRDLIYGIEGDVYRYYFTVEYTLHAISARSRVQRVATFTEQRGCHDELAADQSRLREAELGASLIEQYRALHDSPERKSTMEPEGIQLHEWSDVK